MTIEDEDIDLDAVRGVISVWEGIVMGRVHAERALPHPDHSRIAEMTQVMYESARERKSLRTGDGVAIEEARVKYAALISAYRASSVEAGKHG
jgi:LmbE family N-acetylglucosaminyl deacetylase